MTKREDFSFIARWHLFRMYRCDSFRLLPLLVTTLLKKTTIHHVFGIIWNFIQMRVIAKRRNVLLLFFLTKKTTGGWLFSRHNGVSLLVGIIGVEPSAVHLLRLWHRP